MTGTIAGDASYETGPVPVVEHQGRVYRAFERLAPPFTWGTGYQAVVVHAPLYYPKSNAGSDDGTGTGTGAGAGNGDDAEYARSTDLLDRSIWQITEPLAFDAKWLDQVCLHAGAS
jgi:hypothetical protein